MLGLPRTELPKSRQSVVSRETLTEFHTHFCIRKLRADLLLRHMPIGPPDEETPLGGEQPLRPRTW